MLSYTPFLKTGEYRCLCRASEGAEEGLSESSTSPFSLERATGVVRREENASLVLHHKDTRRPLAASNEPVRSVWKTETLPLSYARILCSMFLYFVPGVPNRCALQP